MSVLTACNDEIPSGTDNEDDSGVIHVGGIDTSDALSISSDVITRAAKKDAETVDWLIDALKNGLDITYGKVADTEEERQEKVAILRLEDSDKTNVGNPDYDKEGDYAVYTFNLRAENGDRSDTPAKWRGNGPHYFEGLYVPSEIRYTDAVSEIEVTSKAPNLSSDQSGNNYTLLSHYLGMAANTRLQATIERVKLPFRHRMAHVAAYILIDPVLGGAKIEGYKGKLHDQTTEDPKTSAIYFRNVKVLSGVKDEYNNITKLHTLTPQWEQASRVTPHFLGEHSSKDCRIFSDKYRADDGITYDETKFIMFKNNDVSTTSELANIYPSSDKTSDKWKTAYNAWYAKYNDGTKTDETEKINHANSTSGYTRVVYDKVPVYDIIVRPTYTSVDSVMYDENLGTMTKEQFANITNQIDFDITLDNGLQYTKEFEFDLDANYQTVVYLRISREKVDYNDSGSAKWIEYSREDGYYGVNNKNGNTLSKAGSSWQRAYTYGYQVSETPGNINGVTDGQFYNASNSHEENENAQYFTSTYKDQWVEKFLQAYKEGKHHGDYFALRDNIEIDARLIPKDFVFTGHLDAQDKTITLTHTGEQAYKTAESLEGVFTKEGNEYVLYNVPNQLYRKNDTREYYSSDEIIEINNTYYVKSTVNIKPAIYYSVEEIEQAKAIIEAEGYKAGDNPEAEITAKKTIEDIKTPEQYDTSHATSANVGDVKSGSITYDIVSPTLDIVLGNDNLFLDDRGQSSFSHPTALYQKSHESPAYLFAGLNGEYITAQENAEKAGTSIYNNQNVVWEANVHKETNSKDMNGTGASKEHWVPTIGYRAEVLNVRMVSPAVLFKDTPTPYNGNVQNCWNGATKIPNVTPALPDYK